MGGTDSSKDPDPSNSNSFGSSSGSVPEPDPAKTGFVTPLLRISFPGRPIFILFIPVDEDVAGVLVGLIGLVVEVHGGHAALLEVAQADEAVLRRGGESVKIHKINRF